MQNYKVYDFKIEILESEFFKSLDEEMKSEMLKQVNEA